MEARQPNSEPAQNSWEPQVNESALAPEQLHWEARVDALRTVLNKLLISPSTSVEEIGRIILSRAQRLTGSQHGFVSSIDPLVGSLTVYASSGMLGSEYPMEGSNAKFVFLRGRDGGYPGLLGVSLNSGQAFYSNAPASHPASTGLPGGHIHLERFLSLPVLIGSQVVGLIALANSEKDYSGQDLAAIQPLAESLTLVIQRSRNEIELQKSEAFNRSIIDNSTDCINVLDLEGRLQYMCQGGQQQMGIKDIVPYLNSAYEDFWKNEDRQDAREAISKARQGKTGTFQGFCPTLEGVPKWWEVVISPIWNGGAETEKLLAVSRDISERKGLEEALQEADRFNHAAADALSAHLAILDENGFILTVNQAWRDFALANAGEPTHLCEGVNYLAVCDAAYGLDSEEGTAFAAGMRAVLQGKQDDFALEYPCHAPHEKRWFIGKVTHFKSKGMIYLVVAHENITVSKQADEALRQSNAQLEQRIEERTAQLANANQRLEDKITELEQSHDLSRDLAARYRIVADNTFDWEFWLDPGGQFLYSSPSCRRITGYDVEDFLGDPTLLERIIHPDDLPIWQKHHAEEVLDKTGKKIEIRILRKDGTIGWIEHVCQPVFNDLGQFLGNRCSHRDISQRKQGEDALRMSERRFQQMVESITTYIYSVKVEAGRPLSFLHGPGCLGLTGYSADEFASNADLWLQMAHPEDRALATQQADRVLAGATVLPLEHRIIRKDGSICWVKNMPIAQFNKKGDLTGYDGIITDISERKLAQQALLESHRFYREIIAGAGEGIFALDRQLNYVLWNPGMEKLTGLGEKDMLGKKVLDISPALKGQGFSRLLERGLMGETVVSPDFRFLIPQTGKSGWLSGTCTPLHDNDGNIIGVIVVLVDINERKQAEEDIRKQSERAAALLHVAARLNIQLDLDLLLRTICEEATTMLHAPAAWISLYKPEQSSLCYAADYGMPPGFKEGYKAPPRGLYGRDTAQLPRIILTPDVQILAGSPNRDLYTALDIRTLAIGSIQRDDHLIGALCVISYMEERAFSVDELALLRGLTDLAAQAIENARLFTSTQRHLNLQRTLHQIELTITSTIQMEPSLKIILQLVADQLNLDAAMVLLVNPQSEALDDIASYGFTANQSKLHLEKGEGYASRILLDRSPIHIPDLTQAENWVSPTLLDLKKVVCYYGTPLIIQDKVIGVLEFFNASPFDPNPEWLRTVEALVTQTAIAIDHATLFHNLRQANLDLSQAYDTTLEGWSHAMDLRDKETEGHTQRVTAMSLRLANAMGLGNAELLNIRRGALLHDMGKMGIPDVILLKPEPLTDEEWIIMRKHPVFAHDLISPIAHLHSAIDIPYCHHEKWDGSGYPRGLKGEEIPLAARIFAIADVWDALISDRPYRSAWSTVRTRQHIQELSDSHFDPRVVVAFLRMIDEPHNQPSNQTLDVQTRDLC